MKKSVLRLRSQLVMLVSLLQNGRRFLRSSIQGPNGAPFSIALWGAGSVISVARSIAVSSVVKTTLGMATTDRPLLARELRSRHLARGSLQQLHPMTLRLRSSLSRDLPKKTAAAGGGLVCLQMRCSVTIHHFSWSSLRERRVSLRQFSLLGSPLCLQSISSAPKLCLSPWMWSMRACGSRS